MDNQKSPFKVYIKGIGRIKKLQERAAKRGISINALLAAIIEHWADRQ
jgi:hypothetical protein